MSLVGLLLAYDVIVRHVPRVRYIIFIRLVFTPAISSCLCCVYVEGAVTSHKFGWYIYLVLVGVYASIHGHQSLWPQRSRYS